MKDLPFLSESSRIISLHYLALKGLRLNPLTHLKQSISLFSIQANIHGHVTDAARLTTQSI